jgi:fatty acid desaturase
MAPTQPPHTQGRESFLAVLLAALCGGGFLLFLIFVSGGFFFYVLCVAAVVTALGFLHYALWGHAFRQQLAASDEDQPPEDSFPYDSRNGPAGRRRL